MEFEKTPGEDSEYCYLFPFIVPEILESDNWIIIQLFVNDFSSCKKIMKLTPSTRNGSFISVSFAGIPYMQLVTHIFDGNCFCETWFRLLKMDSSRRFAERVGGLNLLSRLLNEHLKVNM